MAQRIDPYKGYRFLVEIDDIQQAAFAECSGLGSEIEIVEYREGGDGSPVRKVPGRVKYPNIVLKWGVTGSRELYDWHLRIINGTLERKRGSVVLQDDQGQEKMRWHFSDAWPSKWEGPALNARGNDVAIEALTLTCERIELA